MMAWIDTLSPERLQVWNVRLSSLVMVLTILTGVLAILSGITAGTLIKIGRRIDTLKDAHMQALQIQIENNRATVVQHLAERDVTEEQAKQLKMSLASLKDHPITILVVPHYPEAKKFADKLAASLTASGLVVTRAGGSAFGAETPNGFGLATGSRRKEDGIAIRKALADSNLAKGFIQTIPESSPMELQLFVGPKP